MFAMSLDELQNETLDILHDLNEQYPLSDKQLFVIGCSTSEVIGEKIGTHGAGDVAEALFTAFTTFQQETNVQLAFQCCEHLNRALVVERATAEKYGFEQVTVVPKPFAGGQMATYAYEHLQDPVMVEFIRADAGIDIGDTFIGMHLKHVAVPLRARRNQIGQAHVTLAKTRPKLIGGVRACYE